MYYAYHPLPNYITFNIKELVVRYDKETSTNVLLTINDFLKGKIFISIIIKLNPTFSLKSNPNITPSNSCPLLYEEMHIWIFDGQDYRATPGTFHNCIFICQCPEVRMNTLAMVWMKFKWTSIIWTGIVGFP